MYENLQIVFWPDPRLRAVSKNVAVFDDNLKALTDRMFVLMREHRGVGLAAPQVGLNIRLFVMNATGEPQDDQIYVNPVLSEAEGEEEGEEGCLSLPKLNLDVWRYTTLRITAQDITGKPVQHYGTGYLARIWQHEYDHLNGVMLTDRMGPVAKLTNRKLLSDLKATYDKDHPPTKKKQKK